MVQAVDLFELIVDALNKCFGWVLPEKYFTFELDIIVGTIIKMICFIYTLSILDILNPIFFGFYTAIWSCQGIFVISERSFIFDGISRTRKRQFSLKYLCIAQSFLGALLFFLTSSLSLIFLYIVLGFLFLDFVQLFLIRCCNTQFEDYEIPGFSQSFLKFRLLGGIIGIIIMLIIYLVFRNQEDFQSSFFQYFIPIMMFFEALILTATVYQLRQKRKKEKLILNDNQTKNKLKMKKWYCIIIGFNYGLVEVLISLQIAGLIIFLFLYFCFLNLLHSSFDCQQDLKIYFILLNAKEIIDYEIVEQTQEDQLNQ